MGNPHKVTFKVKLAVIQTRVFLLYKGTHIHVFLYNICHTYMSYHILFEGVYFVLSYSTHIWNACLNYREFDLEGDLVGVPHTWYLSTQSFIILLKFV